MTTDPEYQAYLAEKREAQLHQFAAAALTGNVSNGMGCEMACRMAWKHAVEMMKLKGEYVALASVDTGDV